MDGFEARERKVFAELAKLAERFVVQKILLFGSRARRTHQPKSDFDFAVYGCRDFAGFAAECDEEIETLLQFDMVNMSDGVVSRQLQEEIAKDGVVIYEKVC